MDCGSEENEIDMLDALDSSNPAPLLLPPTTINDKNFLNNTDFKEDFLRLTSMVRRVYFSYLHKSLVSNYVISCQSKDMEDFDSRIKNCASQMELFAVRSALETSLYRKAMTKLISEVKEHTKEQKLHKTLTSFFISPPEKVDIAVQTDEVEAIKTEKFNEIPKSTISIEHQNNSSVDNFNNSTVTIKTEPLSNDFINIEAELASSNLNSGTKIPLNDFNNDAELTSSNLNSGTKLPPNDLCLRTKSPSSHLNFENESPSTNVSVGTLLSNNLNVGIDSSKNLALSSIPDSELQSQILLHDTQTFNKSDQSFLDDSVKTKADDSQDSLFQTMEDMFCESDDSSDIMTLIEKHSSSTHSENPCPKTPKTPEMVNNFENKIAPRVHKRKHISRVSSSSVKSKKRRNSTSSPVGFNELKGARYKKKVNEIWLVERVNQTSKLKTKMMEISLLDYRKYGRIKAKFLEFFGESDAEDTLPYSPVFIEEHLQACKERIAPWIVKHLTPFYKHKRISSRQLFKTTCRHVTDMLIINDTFPDESSVENYMQVFFKNKKSIKTEADIYL